METPDITKAQLLALAQAIIAVLVAFGVSLSLAQQGALLGLSAIVASTLVAADVAIRRGRQLHLGGIRPDSLTVADVHDALASVQALKVKAAPENVSLSQAQTARREQIGDAVADVANGPQPEPGTYPTEDPPGDTPEPQQPAF